MRRLSTLARRLFSRFTTKPAAGVPNPLRFRPRLEQCEDRTVPTPVVTIQALADATEGGAAGTFRLTRTETTGSLSVGLFAGGTATSGSDYASIGSANFANGQATVDVNVTATDDSAQESIETLILGITPFYIYTVGTPASAFIFLHDNDTPVVTVAKLADTTEGGTAGTFRFTRTGSNYSTLTVNFTVGGTATSGTDYSALGTSVTFAADAYSVEVPLTALTDNRVEGTETVSVTLSSGSAYEIGTASTATASLYDDRPLVSVTATDTIEGGTDGSFVFTRSGGKLSEALPVVYTVTGSATATDDYTALSGLVTFAANQTSVTVMLTPVNDTTSEYEETVHVEIAPSEDHPTEMGDKGYVIDSGITIAIIRDNDSSASLWSGPVNLIADTIADGAFDLEDDQLEDDDIGKLVFVNNDEDDGDGVMDYQQTGAVAGEDDLAEVKLHVASGYSGMTVRLSVSGDTTAARLWALPDRTGLLGSTESYVIGTDTIPSSIYVEGLATGLVTLKLELLYPNGDPFLINANPAADLLKARITLFDLDVTGNVQTNDPDDGFHNYMPGYRGATPKLSTGAFNALTVLKPQALDAVFNGLGSNVGVGKIQAALNGISNHKGYAGNAADPDGNMYDVSFLDTEDKTRTDTLAGGRVIADKSWISFYVRDYAAAARLDVNVYDTTGAVRGNHSRQVVRDTDKDNLQDGWEEQQVTAFENQFWVTVPNILGRFSTDSDSEYADPDGAGNGDGARNLVAHKAEGDSLTAFQEYRGFILDGGGFDGAGQNGHAGGHNRLSPAHKELLVEVDTMPKANVADMPTAPDLKTILEGVSKGFSDGNNGAGIRVYWVIDEPSAEYKVFPTSREASKWARAHRNSAQLSEFIHVMFTGPVINIAGYGLTIERSGNSGGCFVYPNRLTAAAPPADRLSWSAHTMAHELTHAIIDTADENGFNDKEHILDPDPTDPPEEPLDRRYLMSTSRTGADRVRIIFDDTTRGQIDLTRKESVEL